MDRNSYYAGISPSAASTTSEPFSQSMLSASISSLPGAPASRQSSQISKAYRQSSTLFLTRRLPEALSTLLPLVSPPETTVDDDTPREPAPLARASRTSRVKVWSLYLTVLNAIVELDPEEAKDAFGNQEWRALCKKIREGDIWDEVVRNGYHGVEGDVDSDVVINLATLLLAHARDQVLNQKRLEAYLASTTTPSFDLTSKLSQPQSPGPRMSARYRSPAKGPSGAATPRDLNARVKILELYTLHVLIRNEEWDYAREFISASAVLDDERREAFLQALESLKEEQVEQERLEREEYERQQEQLRQDIEIAKRLKAENEERERRRLEEGQQRRQGSEIDYGIDQAPSSSGSARGSRPPARKESSSSARPSKSALSRGAGKGAAVPPTFTARAAMVLTRIQQLVARIGASLNGDPALVMRLAAFIVGLLLMFGHAGLRERIQRILRTSWGKVSATAGMGTKVSYI